VLLARATAVPVVQRQVRPSHLGTLLPLPGLRVAALPVLPVLLGHRQHKRCRRLPERLQPK